MAVESLAALALRARLPATKQAFAKRTGLSEPTIYKLEHGLGVEPETIDKLVAVVDAAMAREIKAAAEREERIWDRTAARKGRTSRAVSASKDRHTTEPAGVPEGGNVSEVPDRALFEKLTAAWTLMGRSARRRLINTAVQSIQESSTTRGPAAGKAVGRRPRP